MGHLARDCPERCHNHSHSNGRPEHNERNARRGGNVHRSKKERFKKAFNEASSSESEHEDTSPRAHVAVDDDGDKSEDDNSLAAHAARMYAPLKG